MQRRVDNLYDCRPSFTRKGSVLIVMLAGGDKSTRTREIKRAQRVVNELETEGYDKSEAETAAV